MNKTPIHPHRVHKILAHSYSVYLVLFLIGVSLDFIFKFRIFTNSVATPLGITLLILGTFLIVWAQKSSRNLDLNTQNPSKEIFFEGPYAYTRHPTHWGLFFLTLGFAIIVNALFVVLFTLFALIITKNFFIKRQEKVMAEKYGTAYLEYKKSVRL